MWCALLDRWKRFGRRLGDIQARALLVVFYFLFLSPFALAVRWLTDPLAIKPGVPRGWRSKDHAPGISMDSARRQS